MTTEVDNQNVTQTPQQGTSESDQAAIARYQESLKSQEERDSDNSLPEGYNSDGTVKEELIAGKFKSQEDLLTAYKELEKKLGQPTPQQEPTAPPVTEEQEITEAPDGKAFNPASYEQEFATQGELSEASYAELNKRGFTKDMVDQYIAGKKYYADSVTNKIYAATGGEEQYAEMVNWASQNMPVDVIKEYNDSLMALDEARITRNIEYMKFKMAESQPNDVRRLEGEGSPGGIQPFADKNEWQRAQTNRLYGQDRKYTNLVDSRYLAARKRGIL